ncbi:CRISPR-associated protein [Mycobacterium tuberculosis]|nr:CRISPR-associated protein [Mycobacterium tuberculosis]
MSGGAGGTGGAAGLLGWGANGGAGGLGDGVGVDRGTGGAGGRGGLLYGGYGVSGPGGDGRTVPLEIIHVTEPTVHANVNGGPTSTILVDTGSVNRPGMSGDSSSWKGWGHVRWFIEEVPAGAA